MAFRILINREECEVRVAFLENQDLVELHSEKFDEQTIVNNIYRGRVQDVVPGLQAAFVDVGLERNMFLHFMDIRPESLVLSAENQLDAIREASKKTLPGRIEQKGRRPRQDPNAPQAAPPVKRGDEIVVQVMKDEIGGKAPRVTANLSLAGRFLVMLPFPSQEGGVSKKIEMGQDRHRLRKLLSGLKTDDYSFIVRTAGTEQPDDSISKDARSLVRNWENILNRYQRLDGPGLIYDDHDLLIRLVRDAFPSDFQEVICDNADDAEEIRRLLDEVMPDLADRVQVYDKRENIFQSSGVEKQIQLSLDRKYWLKSGGSLVIDENEALTAIDVNTGRFTGKKDQEKTSLKTNMEACEAIAHEIRLRDIGGIIVIDFIDMLSRQNQERVSEELRRALRKDRAKTAVGRIGDFGLMMLTRKRQRTSLQKQVFDQCPYCTGTGWVISPDQIFRRMKYDIFQAIESDEKVRAIVLCAHPRLIDALSNRYHGFMEQLKKDNNVGIVFRADLDYHLEDYQVIPVLGKDLSMVQLPDRGRVEKEDRVLPPVEDPILLQKASYAEPAEVVAEVVQQVAEGAEGTPSAAELERIEEEARLKRRRESSADRRARRRRARERHDDKPEASGKEVEKTAPKAPKPAEVVAVAELKDAPDLIAEDEAEKETRRKTRRGSRGGRTRRRKEDEEVGKPVVSPSKPAAPLAPIKMVVKKSEDADLFNSVLASIEKAVSTIEFKPQDPRKVAKKPVIKKPVDDTPVVTSALLDSLEAAVEAERQKDKKGKKAIAPSKQKAASRRRPASRKKKDDTPVKEVVVSAPKAKAKTAPAKVEVKPVKVAPKAKKSPAQKRPAKAPAVRAVPTVNKAAASKKKAEPEKKTVKKAAVKTVVARTSKKAKEPVKAKEAPAPKAKVKAKPAAGKATTTARKPKKVAEKPVAKSEVKAKPQTARKKKTVRK